MDRHITTTLLITVAVLTLGHVVGLLMSSQFYMFAIIGSPRRRNRLEPDRPHSGGHRRHRHLHKGPQGRILDVDTGSRYRDLGDATVRVVRRWLAASRDRQVHPGLRPAGLARHLARPDHDAPCHRLLRRHLPDGDGRRVDIRFHHQAVQEGHAPRRPRRRQGPWGRNGRRHRPGRAAAVELGKQARGA